MKTDVRHHKMVARPRGKREQTCDPETKAIDFTSRDGGNTLELKISLNNDAVRGKRNKEQV